MVWLLATQRPDGGWYEPQFTGTGFPADFYINYHLYRLVFPVMALGRCLRDMGAYSTAIARFYSVINSTLKLPAGGFTLDLARLDAQLAGARALVLNSPGNPTGWTATTT